MEELIKELSRTEISIQQRIVYLKNKGKIEKEKHNTLYTENENNYLINNYRSKTPEELSEELKRTPLAIKQQIARLKKIGKIKEKPDFQKVLKNMMITKRDILKNKVLSYEKIMIAEKLETTIDEVELEFKKLREKWQERKLERGENAG